ncbi:MAG TPA: cyclopropane-fatty-acyl-phospholipid synthase family protein [Hyphomicrobiaceae bacterium]|nr:cyclopropane-fatty-acyl-phospholipid synthase family protein [Hyphomicrobiaceae bacterium]
MFKPLSLMLDRIVRTGNLTFIDSQGSSNRFGDGSGSPVLIRLKDRKLERELVLDPELASGEAYMQGRLVVEEGSLYDFIALMMANLADSPFPAWSQSLAAARRFVRRLKQFNPIGRARHNAAHHYDIDPRIYDLFLDPDRQYSCAYFTREGGLAHAQLAKKRHIAAKLLLEPGQRVLDIGSGWGGLALYLAKIAGADVTGITLSEEQLKSSRARAAELGLAQAVRFQLADYREIGGQFDRIVSIGMFEHVGLPHYATFFRTLNGLLAGDGVALLHTIGRSDRPGATNPFIAKHIFPGGYLPALSEVMAAIEKSGFIATDIEVLRLHYAETLKAWRERFLENRARAADIAGEEFCRMWEFYLAGCEAAFRYQNLVVFQIQLTKRIGTLPITRDYMLEAERRLAAREAGAREASPLAAE